MKIAILSKGRAKLFYTAIEASCQRAWSLSRIKTSPNAMLQLKKTQKVFITRESIIWLDVIIPTQPKPIPNGTAIVRQFEMQGVFTTS